MNLKLAVFDLDMEDATCRLPIDWFIADWSMHKEGAVRFDD
jgi:hypothetical protein